MMWSALYSAKPLETILDDALGDATLEDGVTDSTSLLVTSFDLDRRVSRRQDIGPGRSQANQTMYACRLRIHHAMLLLVKLMA